jgi:hypothetical protein
MEGAYAAAAGRLGVVERSFRIAGRDIRAKFAGPALLPTIEPALAHLARTAGQERPSLTVHLWDSASSKVEVPRAPAQDPTESAPAESVAAVRTSYHLVPKILTLYDASSRSAVYWVPDASAVPSNEIASPLRTLLHWWARDEGLQFVHAGAIGLGDSAVLVGGPSGSGKSTTALACLLDGLDYLGDDYVLVDDQSATIYSLYSAAKLQPEQVTAFPELRAALTNADRLGTEKALWFVHDSHGHRTRAAATAVAVLIPSVTHGQQSTLKPVGRGTALAAIAPSTIAQLSATEGSLAAIARFLGRIPAYRLEAGRDLTGLARTVRELLVGGSLAS